MSFLLFRRPERLTVALYAVLVLNCFGQAPADSQPVAADYLSLREFIRRVLAQNENVQIQLLEVEANRQRYKGEKGVFEPGLVTSYDHEENKHETTLQEQISTRTTIFHEKNNIYNAGLESLLPMGGRVQLGYKLRDLRNNLSSVNFFGASYNPILTNRQYTSFAGLSLVQPFLKNGGYNATLASIRLAAMSSEIAYQDYRRQLMLILSKAEASYWNLYLAQEQVLFFRESVALAEMLVKDNEERLKAGKGSELEVMEAQSGLALRRSKQGEAREKYFEALNQLILAYGGSALTTNRLVVAVDEPKVSHEDSSYFEAWQSAFENNPDYLIQRKKLMAENIRLAYAKNQRLPQLDLKASYGLNGLGDTPGDSLEQLETTGFPSWSVGVEMRIPLGGGIKARSEVNAAKLRQKQALLGLKDLETQIANGLDSSLHKATSARTSAESYKTAVEFSKHLLSSQMERLKVGKVESRKVLEVEADLFEAKNALVEAKIQYQRAALEEELIQGSLLRTRNLDFSKQELEERTRHLIQYSKFSERQLEAIRRDLQVAYLQPPPPPRGVEPRDNPIYQKRGTVPPPAPTKPMTPEQYEEAERLLQGTLQNELLNPK